MAAEPTLAAADRDVLDLALRTQPDPFLSELLELGQHGTELAVGLLVNGMVVLGRLSRDEALAQALSTMRQRLIDSSPKPEGQSDEQWAEIRANFAMAPLQFLAERGELEQQVIGELQGRADEEGSVDLAGIPEDLARQLRELGTRSHITLSEARLSAPGQDGMTAVPVLRVAVAHVTAWWFAMPEDDGTANIELWNA